MTVEADSTVEPLSGKPLTGGFVQGYALGYYYGRAIGDDEVGREELEKRFSDDPRRTGGQWAGFKIGYSDGVNHYVEDEEGPEET